jgi:hypothetical protein
MADDIARRLKDEKVTKNPAGTAECLVDPDRRIVSVGLAKADNPSAISDVLVSDVVEKALPLKLLFTEAGRVVEVPGYAQAGFIRGAIIQSSPGGTPGKYSVYRITAKRNLRQVRDEEKDKIFIPILAKIDVFAVGLVDMASPDFGWIPTENDIIDLRRGDAGSRPAICNYGFDMSVGAIIDNPAEPVTEPIYSFPLVRKQLPLRVGQKVGIAVKFCEDSKPTRDTITGAKAGHSTLSDAQIKAIYGEPGVVNVYTGKITFVGDNHIEYDINTFTGCSGSVVFLLDMDQPSPVEPNDHGCAIAIHAGAHPSLRNRNYGFIIRCHPEFIGWE